MKISKIMALANAGLISDKEANTLISCSVLTGQLDNNREVK